MMGKNLPAGCVSQAVFAGRDADVSVPAKGAGTNIRAGKQAGVKSFFPEGRQRFMPGGPRGCDRERSPAERAVPGGTFPFRKPPGRKVALWRAI